MTFKLVRAFAALARALVEWTSRTAPNTLVTVMKERLDRLFRHAAWANRAVVERLKSQTSLPPKATAILAHVLAAEDVWLHRIRNQPARLAVWADLSLPDCETQTAKNSAAYAQVLEGLDESGLDHAVVYRNSQGVRYESRLEDILLHVCLHGSYHRGQIASLVRASGGEPVNTDYIVFVRSQRDVAGGPGAGR